MLQRAETEGGAGLAEPDAVPQEPGAGGIVSPRKCPHTRSPHYLRGKTIRSLRQSREDSVPRCEYLEDNRRCRAYAERRDKGTERNKGDHGQ